MKGKTAKERAKAGGFKVRHLCGRVVVSVKLQLLCSCVCVHLDPTGV